MVCQILIQVLMKRSQKITLRVFRNVDLLVGEPCHVTDNGISGGIVSDTLQKWGGNYFQDVSGEYGKKKPQSGRK